MSFWGSRVGYGLTLLYLVAAVWIVQDELRHSGGGWINLRGMGTMLITAPSQATVGELLRKLGVPKVNFSQPGIGGFGELLLHVLVTAALVYLLGYGLELGARRLFGSP